MPDYKSKLYGRNDVVTALFQLFNAGDNVAMPGPRRLGKSFVLDRVVEWAPEHGWRAIKLDVAGISEFKDLYRYLCTEVNKQPQVPSKTWGFITQRFGQVTNPRHEQGSTWFQNLLTHDHQTQFEKILEKLNTDKVTRWALLIDELPIFLKALHDKGPDGITQARNFMNHLARLQAQFPSLRWLITGSIGIEPLAREGQYLALLTKYRPFELLPLSLAQAHDFLFDLATEGRLQHRQSISPAEAQAITNEVQWLSAFYLREVAQNLRGTVQTEAQSVAAQVEAAVQLLIAPQNVQLFGPWEDHLRKHYNDADRRMAIGVLNGLAELNVSSFSTLLAKADTPNLAANQFLSLLTRLHVEGYIQCSDWDAATSSATFSYLSPLLRRRWKRFALPLTA